MTSTFVSYSLVHAATVAACAAAMIASCGMGRACRGGERERRLRRRWGGFIVGFALVSNAWWLWPGNFRLDQSLPLQLCDLAVIVAAVVMLTELPAIRQAPPGRRAERGRWARTLLYFWGIGLSTQAFFTPTLQEGLFRPHFWIFWIGHTAIVGSAVYDVAVRGYRPAFRDLVFAIAVTLAYAAAMLALNVALGLNYGYVGAVEPEQPTIIQKIGPWPARVPVLAAIVLLDFTILWGVWRLVPRPTTRS